MKIVIKKKIEFKGMDCVVIPVFQKIQIELIFKLYPEVKTFWKKFKCKGKIGDGFAVNSGKLSTLLIVVGAGSLKEIKDAGKCARNTITLLMENRVKKAVIHFVQNVKIDTQYIINFFDYLYLNNYVFDIYKKKETKDKKLIKIEVVLANQSRISKNLIKERELIAGNVSRMRDLVNEIPARINPDTLVDYFQQVAGEQGLQISIMREKELKEKKMNGILSVGLGSPYEPALIRIGYTPEKFKKTVVIVGKGVTFDSGGLNIKISNYMEEMKCDMAGAATVLGIVKSVAELRVPVKVIVYAPIAENMPGHKAYKPGDIIIYGNKKSVEVVNTDAEGRLILADALIQAVSEKPDYIMEFSTLTGAIVIALGDLVGGLMCNHHRFGQMLEKSANRTCDFLWQLPLLEEYRESIKSKVADLKNADYKGASSIKAGLFLSEFSGKIPFAHVDIAGTAFISRPNAFYSREGATGFGIRLMIDFLYQLA